MKTCEDCIHIEVCALCAPPLPICDLFMSKDDIASVVRCGECKHQRERNKHEKEYLIEGVLICIHPEVSEDCWAAVFPTHFCSYGERKDNEAD